MTNWNRPPGPDFGKKGPDEPTGETIDARSIIERNIAIDPEVARALKNQAARLTAEQPVAVDPELQRELDAREQVARFINDEAIEAGKGVAHAQSERRRLEDPEADDTLYGAAPSAEGAARIARADRKIVDATLREIVTMKAYEALTQAAGDPEAARSILLNELTAIDKEFLEATRLQSSPGAFVSINRRRDQAMQALELIDREINRTGYEFKKP